MSDDTQGTDVQKTPDGGQQAADAQAGQDKPWRNEAEVKKIIVERDEAKARLKEIAEKEKKLAEDKAVAEGKVKEILAQKEAELAEVKKKAELYEAEQKAIREQALEGLPDEFKSFAEKLPSASDVLAFRKTIETKQSAPYSGKGGTPEPEKRFARKPGESLVDWSKRVDVEMSRSK